jgi:hypothetical protein
MVDSPALPGFRHPPPTLVVAQLLPFHAAVYGTLMAIDHRALGPIHCAVSLWLAAIAALRFPTLRALPWLACLFLNALVFPEVPNHGYVLGLALLAIALFRADLPDERLVLATGYRYLVGIVFFWSGVQKLWSGTWSQAQFLIYEIGHSARFGQVFAWFTNRSEQRAYRMGGPFLGHGLLVWASNFVWIAEIAIGIGLLLSREVMKKRFAWAALLLLVAVEFVARESVFGLLVVGLLWPTVDKRFSIRWLWILVPIELLAILGRMSLVPGGFH